MNIRLTIPGCLLLLVLYIFVSIGDASPSPHNTGSDILLTQEEKSWLAAHPVVNVRVSRNYPPFEFFEQGRFQGISYDYLGVIGKQLGIEFRPVPDMMWKDALESLRNRDGVDLVLMITKDESRDWFVEFTHNYISFPQTIFVRKDSKFISNINDLSGGTVVTENGFIEAEKLRRDAPNVSIIEAATTVAALKAVATGKADAYVGNLAVASYLIEKNGFVNLKVAAPSPYANDTYAMGVRKDWAVLAHILDKSIAAIPDAEQRRIQQKWLSIRYEHGISPRDVLKWGLAVIGIALLFIIQLRRMVRKRTVELEQEISVRNLAEESLLESRNQLHKQNDELLATEEMLRVQIEEFEISQRLLKESNLNLQTLFDLSPFSIAISTASNGKILEVNKTFCRVMGYYADDFGGNKLCDIGLWSNNIEHDRFLNLLNEQNEVSGFTAKITTSAGEIRDALFFSRFMNYKTEKCLLTVIVDVTEHKRLEDDLRQAQKMEIIGQLAGGVAHDFNNMLSAIMGASQLLANHIEADSRAVKYLAIIDNASSRSADLTSQLLTFSRKGQKTIVPVCITETISMVISLLERTIDKNITLEARLHAENTTVAGDPTLLQNALLNLGINARDAMPEGGTITYATDNVWLSPDYIESQNMQIAPGRYMEISVTDSGVGMSKEVVERIFEPFFTTKECGKGTGLGLAVVYGTVKDHQGAIAVQSESGTGTIFKLYLPLSMEAAASVKKSEESIEGSGRILLVDDEPLVRMVGKALLEDLGYQVYLAEDGKEALDIYACEGNSIFLVILDVVMPRSGGKETLKRLMEIAPDINILMSSGFHQDDIDSEILGLGAKGFIRKPYSRAELGKAVADMIGN